MERFLTPAPPTLVRRPERWDQPLDPSVTDADVAWLRSRQPFASLDHGSFPKTTPLDGVLRNDCRILRCEPGEVLVREGDYGGSAFLVLAGEVGVIVGGLPAAYLGRQPAQKLSWIQSLSRWWSRSPHAEARSIDEISLDNTSGGGASLGAVDDRPVLLLQDYSAILNARGPTRLGPGEMFGEVAAMYRTPHAATVIASTEATVVEIRWQGLRLLRRDRRFADQLEQHYRSHWLRLHLGEISLLRHVPAGSLDRIVGSVGLRSYGRMEWNADFRQARKLAAREQIEREPVVAMEGHAPTDLIIIRSGFARTSQSYGSGHRTTAYLGCGHFFGLDEIVQAIHRQDDQPAIPLQHSLRAIGFLDTLQIPIETFATEILPYVRQSELPESCQRTLRAARSRRGTTGADRRESVRDPDPTQSQTSGSDHPARTGHQLDHTGQMEFIVQNRLLNGRQAMVIDLNRCTRCDDCVRACGETHDGNPRFVREGLTHGHLQFVQACMQCSDPVCMLGCPTGAIHRHPTTGVVQIQESICVGCGICAASCPYESIRMATISDRSGNPYRDSRTHQTVSKATKCDMCQSQPSGPACVASCPHDALVRIDLTQSRPLQAFLEQRGPWQRREP